MCHTKAASITTSKATQAINASKAIQQLPSEHTCRPARESLEPRKPVVTEQPARPPPHKFFLDLDEPSWADLTSEFNDSDGLAWEWLLDPVPRDIAQDRAEARECIRAAVRAEYARYKARYTIDFTRFPADMCPLLEATSKRVWAERSALMSAALDG